MGNRMSALGISQYCGQSAKLNLGAGRAAAMSTAFHARCSDPSSAATRKLLDALSDEEREDISKWHKPEPLTALGLSLAYSAAETEFTLGLDDSGAFTTKEADAVTVGHADMGWVVRTEIEGTACKVAVVGDIKRQRWTTPEGPSALQLQAYGHALAQKHNADYFLAALWFAEEGYWMVGELQSMFGLSAASRWARIHGAATNDDPSYSHGPHCNGCYARLQCPAHMVRYGDVLVVPGTTEPELNRESALELLTNARRWEDTAEAAKRHLKVWVERNGPIPDGAGKAWTSVPIKGRESVVTPEKLRELLGEEAERFIKTGPPSTQYRWTKA